MNKIHKKLQLFYFIYNQNQKREVKESLIKLRLVEITENCLYG